MFSVNRMGLSNEINPEIVRKLTAIRIAGYKNTLINQEINQSDELAVGQLALAIGEKILKINLIGNEGTSHYKSIRSQLQKIIKQLSTNKLRLVAYAADLLQFYTIICSQEFYPESRLREFLQLLDHGSNKFGDAQSNLFIIEYELGKIYDELLLLSDEFINTQQLSEAISANHTLIETRLKLLGEALNTYLIAEPDNVFLHYLLLLHSYTSAQLLEYRYIQREQQLAQAEYLELANAQKTLLNTAKNALDTISLLAQFNQDYQIQYGHGLEFTLGQDLLRKFPTPNLEALRTHLLSFLKDTGTEEYRGNPEVH